MELLLGNSDSQTVWTAKMFAIRRPPPRFRELPGAPTPLELNTALLDDFFPGASLAPSASILLAFKVCPQLLASEIERALGRCSPSSAPGPDPVPNSLWKRINKTAPHLFLNYLSPMVTYGFHQPSLKKADGIVLDKPGKHSYNSLRPFGLSYSFGPFPRFLRQS